MTIWTANNTIVNYNFVKRIIKVDRDQNIQNVVFVLT